MAARSPVTTQWSTLQQLGLITSGPLHLVLPAIYRLHPLMAMVMAIIGYQATITVDPKNDAKLFIGHRPGTFNANFLRENKTLIVKPGLFSVALDSHISHNCHTIDHWLP